MKTYQEIVDYIYGIPKFTKKNTQNDTRLFYAFLKKPGIKQKIIHVAGTNGKGSVCAYVNQILVESGCSVGMFTSPHLVHIEERFQMNGEQINREKFVELFMYILEKIKTYQKTNPDYFPTFFEFLFFMAMQYFENQKTMFIILETGLGGRLDATNIIEEPLVCVITKIGLDHTEYLGNSISQIASEKAGIIKKNVPVVYWNENENVNTVIEAKAGKENAKLYPINQKNVKIVKNRDKKIDFSYNSSYYKDMYCKLDTKAFYQVENALIAIKVFEAIHEVISIKTRKIQIGLLKTKWPGRMEEIAPNIYLDGAHNVDGIKAMLQGIQFEKGEKNILLFSVVNDKKYEDMIFELCKAKVFTCVCITKIPGERGIETEILKEIFNKYGEADIFVIDNAKDAYQYCIEQKRKDQKIHSLYVTGSLYLIGLIKEIVEENKPDLNVEELT